MNLYHNKTKNADISVKVMNQESIKKGITNLFYYNFRYFKFYLTKWNNSKIIKKIKICMDRPRFPSIIMWKKNIKFELLQDYK